LRIYIDTSAYNRPFDDQTQPRISLETQALNLVLQLVEAQALELVSSSILEYENSRNPFAIRQEWVELQFQLAKSYQQINGVIVERAHELQQLGLGEIDALHVACAEAVGSDYFLTCDDRLIRRYQGSLNVINPVNFVLDMTGE
jgi:predicted nucleic acid-binding protein